MLLMLLLQTLQKHLLNLLLGKTEVAEEILLAEAAVQLLSRFIQPIQKLLGQLIGGTLHILEIFQKGTVEFIKIRLAFDQNGTAEIIKPRKGGMMQTLVECLNEGHPLVEGNLQPSGTKEIEK